MEEQYLRSRAYQLKQDLILDSVRYGALKIETPSREQTSISEETSIRLMEQNIQNTKDGLDKLVQKGKIEKRVGSNGGMFQGPTCGI